MCYLFIDMYKVCIIIQIQMHNHHSTIIALGSSKDSLAIVLAPIHHSNVRWYVRVTHYIITILDSSLARITRLPGMIFGSPDFVR